MKKLNLVFISLILFSCNQKTSHMAADDLVVTIDTVMVDAGGEILYLEDLAFALSPDKRYLYNFNRYGHTIEKIDLDELSLVDKLPFEKEGPNGTGDHVYYMNMLGENHVHIADLWTSGVFDLDGTKIASLNLYDEGFQGEIISEYEQWRNSVIIPGQPEILFALVSNWKDGSVNLRRIDVRQKLIRKYDFDQRGKFPQFSLRVPDLSKDPIVRPYLYLSVENGQLIISSDITSEIHQYDAVGDSLISKESSHQLTVSEKKGGFLGVYASMEELMVDYQKVLEEVSFSPPVWDSVNKRYYRFSNRVEFGKEKELGALLPNHIRTHVYLSIYDENFNLVAEAAVPQVTNSQWYFARGGDIWIPQNIADEMAFIRVSLE